PSTVLLTSFMPALLTAAISPPSLHDALPIYVAVRFAPRGVVPSALVSSAPRLVPTPLNVVRPPPLVLTVRFCPPPAISALKVTRSAAHTSALESRVDVVCRVLLEKVKSPGEV